MQCPKFLLHLLTEPDNKTFCPVRVVSLIGCFQYFMHSGYMVYKTSTFDPQAYAVGLGALVAGVGVALGLKKDTPKQDDQPKQ